MLPSISLSPLIAGVLIALVVYILFRIIGSLFQKRLGKANISAINRSLGFLLGVAKGFALVCITIFITKTFLNEAEYPKLVEDLQISSPHRINDNVCSVPVAHVFAEKL